MTSKNGIDSDSALVLFSGGQDSTTCLCWAVNKFRRVEAIGFNYGQKHVIELSQARVIADVLKVPFREVDISGVVQGSALIEHGKEISGPHERRPDLPASFVPGRNAVFLTIAASKAYAMEISNLVGGMCQTDFSGYPDCRRDFIDSMEETLRLAYDSNFFIHTPLMHLTKAETWRLARELGDDVFKIVRDLSHTDYNGNRSVYNEWGYGRLDNPASQLRAKGYFDAKERGWLEGVT